MRDKIRTQLMMKDTRGHSMWVTFKNAYWAMNIGYTLTGKMRTL